MYHRNRGEKSIEITLDEATIIDWIKTNENGTDRERVPGDPMEPVNIIDSHGNIPKQSKSKEQKEFGQI